MLRNKFFSFKILFKLRYFNFELKLRGCRARDLCQIKNSTAHRRAWAVNLLYTIPVDTRCPFNVYKTSIQRYRRGIGALQTLKRRRVSTGVQLPIPLGHKVQLIKSYARCSRFELSCNQLNFLFIINLEHDTIADIIYIYI